MNPAAIDALYHGINGSFGPQSILSPWTKDVELTWGKPPYDERVSFTCLLCGGSVHWGVLRSKCDRCGEYWMNGLQDSRRLLSEAAHRVGVFKITFFLRSRMPNSISSEEAMNQRMHIFCSREFLETGYGGLKWSLVQPNSIPVQILSGLDVPKESAFERISGPDFL